MQRSTGPPRLTQTFDSRGHRGSAAPTERGSALGIAGDSPRGVIAMTRTKGTSKQEVFAKDWVVINGMKVVHRTRSCPEAVAFIDRNGLRSSCLYQCQEMMAELLRDMLPEST